MKIATLSAILIFLLFAVACIVDVNDPVDIDDLTWILSILNGSGECVYTIAAGDTVTLRLEIINETDKDIGITYDHCTPYRFSITNDLEEIWWSPMADCVSYESDLISSGNSLVFEEEWKVTQWNSDHQQYCDPSPGQYAFRARFSGTSVIDNSIHLYIDEFIEFYISD